VLGERRQALHARIVDGMPVVYRDRAAELRLGKVYRQAANKRDQAQEHVTTAATMFRDMGMRFRLAQAEAGT
jgi:hypothetical protein